MSQTDVTVPAAAELVKPETGGAKPRRFQIDQKYVAPILVTMILLVGQYVAQILESYTRLLLAIGTAIVAEIILSRLFRKKWPHLASAYISGISVGMLVRSPWAWPYALCSAITITSKYVIRYKDKHIWNPSNFGISMMLILATDTVATLSIQWGNNVWPMAIIWVMGSVIIYRLKRFHITFTYVASFIAFGLLRSVITGNHWLNEISPITGPMYQLYIFFMITDPPTTVVTKRGQTLVAFLIAAVECVIRLSGSFYSTTSAVIYATHAPYYALFLVGPIAKVIDINIQQKKAKSAAAPSPA
jgi:Na+-translocating ferredoxin:NAD+ oxidoreductase RnfD subunit